MNSFIAWVGGKKALRKLIYTMFPVQFDRYIEVFGGGGWVLFGKPPNLKRKLEVYNDYNSNLANLFYCVKNRTCTRRFIMQKARRHSLTSSDRL